MANYPKKFSLTDSSALSILNLISPKALMLGRLLVVIFVALPAFSQSKARVLELLEKGVALLEDGQYNKAVNLLEEAWEGDPTDPAIAENLAIGYLYADKEVGKAGPLVEKAIALGGRASFLMDHLHEKLQILASDTADYCRGRLSIMPGRMVFVAANPRHSFELDADNVREVKANKLYGAGRGTYNVRTRDKRKFDLRPRSGTPAERQLILELTGKHLKR